MVYVNAGYIIMAACILLIVVACLVTLGVIASARIGQLEERLRVAKLAANTAAYDKLNFEKQISLLQARLTVETAKANRSRIVHSGPIQERYDVE
jgi:hypothetical protein